MKDQSQRKAASEMKKENTGCVLCLPGTQMGLWEEGHREDQPKHMGCQKKGEPTMCSNSRDTASQTAMSLASFRPFEVKWTS